MSFFASLKSAASSIVSKAKELVGGGGSGSGGGGGGASWGSVALRQAVNSMPAFNVAGTTPMMLKQSDQQQPCLICAQVAAWIVKEAAKETVEAVAKNIEEKSAFEAAVKAYKDVRPYVTPITAKRVLTTAFDEKIALSMGSKFLSGLFTGLAFLDAGKEALYLREVASRGLTQETAASASKVIGLATSATASVAAGALTTLAIAALAPAAPALLIIGAVLVVGTLVAKGTELAWNKFGQERTANSFESYIDGGNR